MVRESYLTTSQTGFEDITHSGLKLARESRLGRPLAFTTAREKRFGFRWWQLSLGGWCEKQTETNGRLTDDAVMISPLDYILHDFVLLFIKHPTELLLWLSLTSSAFAPKIIIQHLQYCTLRVFRLLFGHSRRRFGSLWVGPINAALKHTSIMLATVNPNYCVTDPY